MHKVLKGEARPATGRIVLLVLLILGPAALTAALLRFGATELKSDSQLEPFSVVAGSESDSAREVGTLELSWGDPSAVEYRRSAPGRVTHIWVAPGEALDNGDRLIDVDGVSAVLHVGSTPLYRPLGWGSVGADADELKLLLHTLGFLETVTPSGQRLESAEVRGITELGKYLGGARNQLIFDPDWTIFSQRPVEFEGLALDVGDFIDSDVVIGNERSQLLELRFVIASGTASSVRDGTELVLQLPGQETSVAFDDGGENSELRALISDRYSSQTAQISDVVLSRRVPVEYASIPASAILNSTTGRRCVILQASDGSYSPATIEAIPSGRPGLVFAASTFAGQLIVANPSTLDADDRRCS